MATPRKPHLFQKTPIKKVIQKACIACAKQSKSHLRLISKNVALQTVYMDLLKILDIDVSQLEPIKSSIYICDTCIHFTTQIKTLKETCQTHINKLLNTSESRFKRVLIHSASPNERKRNRNCETARKETSMRTSKKSLKFSEKWTKVNHQISETSVVANSESYDSEKEVTARRIPRDSTSLLGDHMYSGSREQVESSETPDSEKVHRTTRTSASLLVDHMYSGSREQVESSETPDSEKENTVHRTLRTSASLLVDHMYSGSREQVESSETPDSEKENTVHRTPPTSASLLVDHMYSGSREQAESSETPDSENENTVHRTPRTSASLLVDHMYSGSREQAESSETPDSEKENTVHRTPRTSASLLVDHMYSGSREQVESSETPDSENENTVHRTPRTSASLLVDHMYSGSMDQPETSPGEDHLYSLHDTASVYKEHSVIKTYTADKRFPSQEVLNFRKIAALSETDCSVIASKIMQLPQLSAAIRRNFVQQISFKLNELCGTGHKSVLRSPLSGLCDKTYLNKVISEMEQRCPFVLDILLAMACPADHT